MSQKAKIKHDVMAHHNFSMKQGEKLCRDL